MHMGIDTADVGHERVIGELYFDLEEEENGYEDLSEQECMAILFSVPPTVVSIPIDPYQDVDF